MAKPPLLLDDFFFDADAGVAGGPLHHASKTLSMSQCCNARAKGCRDAAPGRRCVGLGNRAPVGVCILAGLNGAQKLM